MLYHVIPHMYMCGTKPVYINKHLAQDLKEFAKANDKCPIKIAEYLICLGLYSVDRNIEGPISFDIKSL